MAALAASPIGLLEARGCLRLVTDMVHEDDALCLALACRPLRDALWTRFPPRGIGPAGRRVVGPGWASGCSRVRRVRTRDAAVVGTVARLVKLGDRFAESSGVGASRPARATPVLPAQRDDRAARLPARAAVGAGQGMRLGRGDLH